MSFRPESLKRRSTALHPYPLYREAKARFQRNEQVEGAVLVKDKVSRDPLSSVSRKNTEK
ncbi:hypothetical protein ASD50_06160 [Mesorhizobium sp. Root552]|jgi:hypothetical protein|nr:hypothetical protein ASD50_06160 [Mesorhizobium sp. Root552]